MGLAGYVKGLKKGSHLFHPPLTNLTQKTVKFQWSDDCDKNFN